MSAFTYQLRTGEDIPVLLEALQSAKDWVLSQRVELLLHAEHRPELDAATKAAKLALRLELLRAGELKRYVFRLETAAGPRIVKVAETVTFGNTLEGLLHRSGPRREHRCHLRAQTLGLAVTDTCGFIELHSGVRLRRACQVQTELARNLATWTTFLAGERKRVGDSAYEGAAWAMADMHHRRFFHGDLKGFHGFIDALEPHNDRPARYKLKWLDLGRVGFSLSRRQRIINLYQVFRYVLPDDPHVRALFMSAYCEATGWYTHNPGHACTLVADFLEYKLRTHPTPLD